MTDRSKLPQRDDGTEDTLSCYDELTTILHSKDVEFTDLAETAESEVEISSVRDEREENVKDKIQDLMKSLDDEQALAHQAERSYQKAEQRLKSLKDDQDNTKKTIGNIRSQLSQVKECLNDKSSERNSLSKQQDEISQQIKKGSNARGDHDLYTYVTGVKWLTTSDPNDVKGCIVEKKRIKPFSLNSAEYSQFFITNHLWDQLEPNWHS